MRSCPLATDYTKDMHCDRVAVVVPAYANSIFPASLSVKKAINCMILTAAIPVVQSRAKARLSTKWLEKMCYIYRCRI
jgi:hypothetical protein